MAWLADHFDWILGSAALVLQFFMIKKYWWAPIAGFCYQFFWVYYIMVTREYGFVMPTIGFAFLYMYGMIKWYKEK